MASSFQPALELLKMYHSPSGFLGSERRTAITNLRGKRKDYAASTEG